MSLFDRFRKKADDPQGAPAEAADEPAAATSAPAAERKGVFSGLRKALHKTFALLNTDIRDLFGAEGRLCDDEFLGEVFAVLVKTDMGVGPAGQIRDELKRQFRARKVQMEDVMQVVREKFKELLGQDQRERPVELAQPGPTVIMVVGVNGSGKTTSIAKLAHHFHNVEGLQVVLGAADTFRAAAVEQLTIWAERIGVQIIKGEQGGDPASVAFRAVAQTVESGADVCIVDTAGRLQSQVNLMQQLTKIRRVISKQIPEAPHEVLLVLDATAGQNGISQARGFSEAVQCTGIVLAKLDGTAKGGVVIPIRQQFELPVKYIGTGEREADISPFDVDRFVDALFDQQT